jgi:hypothetical protein
VGQLFGFFCLGCVNLVGLLLNFGFEENILSFEGHDLMNESLSFFFMLISDQGNFLEIGLDDFLKISIKMFLRGNGRDDLFGSLSILCGFEGNINAMGVLVVIRSVSFGSQ